MLFDKENLFSEDQAITATARSTNVIDLGTAETGPGEPIEVLCQVTEDFDSAADDGTLVVALMTDSDAVIGTGGVVLHQTAAIAEAVLVAGYEFRFSAIPNGALRYIDLNFTVAGSGDFTAGKILAGLLFDKQQNNFGG